jgi:hypothetical protein
MMCLDSSLLMMMMRLKVVLTNGEKATDTSFSPDYTAQQPTRQPSSKSFMQVRFIASLAREIMSKNTEGCCNADGMFTTYNST